MTEARTGEFKIEQAKAKSEQEWQELLGKPHALPNGLSNHLRETRISLPQPGAQLSRPGKRIERAAHRDPIGTGGTLVARDAPGKCSFLGPIGVTDQQFQESGVWHVECRACGARRDMKKIKDRQKFPSHAPRKTPPPKGEERWTVREGEWKVSKD